MIRRTLDPFIRNDLSKKMVFVGGPRQVGKTVLAKQIIGDVPGTYFNFDSDSDRQAILHRRWSDSAPVIALDELHKYPRWKTWLKGTYDTRNSAQTFLVTGSARLDVYRRGGDSMLGRYHYWRLHPFSLAELPDGSSGAEALSRLMEVGGFPEPFLTFNAEDARRWRKERYDRVLRDDLRDLEQVSSVQMISLLLDLLRSRVGSPVVVSNLAGDLQVAPQTVKRWIELLERMYVLFVVRPYTTNIARAIQKSPKIYFFDNADVQGDSGAVFENLVATSLLKELHFREDSQGYRYDLAYIRDKEKREVDFVILKERKPVALIEAKWSATEVAPALRYYSQRLKVASAHQVVASVKYRTSHGGIYLWPATQMLSREGLREILE